MIQGAGGKDIEPRASRRSRSFAAHHTRTLAALVLLALTMLAPTAAASTYGPSGGLARAAAPLASSPPKVTKQPANQTVEEGQGVTFATTASGSPTPTAQWEVSKDGGTTWASLEGATEPSLTIAAVKGGENGWQFRVVYKNSVGEATSKAATLTVRAAPVVTLQPASVTVEEGQGAVFESTASGLPAPTVQWQTSSDGGTSWSNVSGATSTRLTIAAASTAISGHEYRAVFKNSVATVDSEAATLTVQTKPVVKFNPTNVTVVEGKNAVFLCTGSGSPRPTEQWEVSSDGGATWTAIEGAHSEFLTVPSATAAMSGWKYRATFTNPAGSATSKAATLTVQSVPVVTKQPTGALVETGEPASFEATAVGTPTPTEQWEESTDAGATWSAVTGATGTQLQIAAATLAEDGHEYRAAFKNAAGTTLTHAAKLTVATTRYTAVGWGMNLNGQLGNGTFTNRFAPVPVKGLAFVSAISAGAKHSLALLLDGSVMAWGSDTSGQLGNEEVEGPQDAPVPVPGLSEVTAVAAGMNHSLALLANGTVMAWGANENGQLGNGGTTASEVPVAVSGLGEVAAIAAGEEFSLALLRNGTVMAWGIDESGQLGNGGSRSSDTPVLVKGLSHVQAIAAGGEFALALREDGTVEAWGDNGAKQLGNVGVEEESRTPVPVEGLSGVSAIAAGRDHALALMSGGTVEAWGDNSSGELGDGTIGEGVATPVAVSALSGVKEISAGGHDSIALLSSGSLMSWGINKFGTLGDGEAGEPSDVPVTVSGLGGAVGVAAGGFHMLAFGESVPTVSALAPKVGAAAGGTSVTITGSSLEGASAVHFGKSPAASFTVRSAHEVVATSPAGTGTVDVTVTTPNGTSATGPTDRFTYEALPTVTKLSAKGGPAAGGSALTITGTELAGVTSVHFGAFETTDITAQSTTSLTVVTPPALGGTVEVTVTNVAGTSAATAKGKFKYTPGVSGVSPSSGSAAGGETVTIAGSGFATGSSATSFRFGSSKVKEVSCASSAECTVTVPAHAPGTVDIVATVGKAKSPVNAPADQFAYN